MSFILDALKKSESDRQRQSGPSLFEVKVAPPRRRLPIWAIAIAVLLVINIAVISWMLLRRPASQPPAAASLAVASLAVASPAAPATQVAGSPAVSSPAPGGSSVAATPAAAPTAAPAAAVTSAGAGAASAAESAPPAGAGEAAKAVTAPSGNRRGAAGSAPLRGTDQSGGPTPGSGSPSDDAPAVEPAGTQDSAAAAGSQAELPLYQQIVTSDGLPTLHLDLHVYAERPQDRFAMINMHRVGEGDALPSGTRVESIRPDGVVLSYHGTRFLLPRN